MSRVESMNARNPVRLRGSSSDRSPVSRHDHLTVQFSGDSRCVRLMSTVKTTTMRKFRMPKRGNGAPAASTTGNAIPSAAALRASGTGVSTGQSSNLVMQIVRFCDTGKIFDAKLSEKPLAMVNMSHGDNPSVLFKQMEAMERYAKARQSEIPDFAGSFKELQEAYEAVFVYVDATTADRDASLSANASGYFIEFSSKAIHDFVVFIDDFVKYVVQEDPKTKINFSGLPTIEVILPPDMILDLKEKKVPQLQGEKDDGKEEEEEEEEEKEEEEKVEEVEASEDEEKTVQQSSFACKINVIYREVPRAALFSLPPPTFPKGHVNLTVDVITSTTVTLIASGCGNLKPFEDELREKGFVRKSFKLAPEAQYASIFWMLDLLPIGDELLLNFEDRIVSKLFRNVPMKVTFRGECSDDKNLAFLHKQVSDSSRVML